LLASHPQVACWPEIFFAGEGSSKDDYFTQSQARDVASFLDRFFLYDWGSINLEGATERRPDAVGFKLKYQQVQRYPSIVDELFSGRKALKIIHLVRENLLATLVSSLIVPKVFERFKDANVLVGKAVDSFQPSVWLNPRTLIAELEALETGIVQARERVAGMSAIEITYEELTTTPSSTSHRVLTFLGVDPEPVLSSRYRKLLPPSPLDSIENGEEVRAALQGSRFETFLAT
jgi:hypothetical protein